MIAESVIISLVAGKLRKGKIFKIFDSKIKGWYLFIIAVILEFSSMYIYNENIYDLGAYINDYFMFIQGAVYMLVLVGLILNFRYKSLIIVFLGTVLNLLVMLINGGKIPVSIEALKYANLAGKIKLLQGGKILTQTISSEITKLAFLGDIIPIPYPNVMAKVISIGDIIIAIGIFVLIQKIMVNKNAFGNNCNMIEFDYLIK
ncbi:DUF5317 family protein [Abyssisolibacter fermentans]|uniref:DUF5317 family protein n=1 Tax=Abyssisolibacter fermentans TaxID=1766203 RepID=UPI00082A81EB|nr:DUF5317 family protein [Abyssisolibacter fermentans]